MSATPTVDKAPRPPSSLTSLPVEILTIVASHVDQQTAASLVRTCRYLTPVFRDRLWRHPEIYVEDLWRLRDNTRRRDADIQKAAIKAKVSSILAQGDQRKWRMVETLRICPRPGTAHGMVYLLECVSANVRRLVVEPGDEFGCGGWRNSDQEPIDLFIRTANLSFPSLTHLTLGNNTVRFAGALAAFTNAAPNLVLLDATIDHDLENGWSVPSFPKQRANSHLRELRISFGRLGGSVFGYTTTDAFEPIFSLLAKSPQIRKLVLQTNGYADYSEDVLDRISEIIAGLGYLTDLHFCAPAKRFANPYPIDEAAFPVLRRVILSVMERPSVDIFRYPPAAPLLEVAIFDGEADGALWTPDITSPAFQKRSPLTLPMIPLFAKQIRLSPRLRVIAHAPDQVNYDGCRDIFASLDRVEAAGGLTGSVYSYRHGGHEVLHVRLFLGSVETADEELGSDEEDEDDDAPSSETTSMVRYIGADGWERKKTFERLEEGLWYDYTDLDGELLPLSVIEQMRIAEGATEEQWQRRGVEVGEEGWRVVEDWRARFEDARESERKEDFEPANILDFLM